jgi:hypothetical protein
MADSGSVLRALIGAYRVLRRDPSGPRLMDLSVSGFWRSFESMAIAAPVLVLDMAFQESARGLAAAPGFERLRYVLVESCSYVVGWLAYPLILAFLLPALGAGARFVPYVIVHNWASVWLALLLIPGEAAYLLGLLSVSQAMLVTLALLVLVLRCQFVIARDVLKAGRGLAAALVAFEFALGVILSEVFDLFAV